MVEIRKLLSVAGCCYILMSTIRYGVVYINIAVEVGSVP